MLGRYTTGPVAARAEHSRCTPPCRLDRRRRPGPGPSPILATHAPDRPPQRHRHQALAGHAPGDGRGRGRRRRLRRRPDGQRPRGACRRAARQGGGAVRRLGHDGQPRRPDGPPGAGPGDDRRREHHIVIDEAAGHAVIVGTSIRSLEDRPDGTLDLGRDRGRVPRPERRARADHRAHHHREHPRPFDGPAADAGVHARRSPPSRAAAASRSTSTARGSGTRSSPSAMPASGPATSPARPTPSRSACRRGSPARSARSSSGRRT